jgi:hypothetical protein
MEQAYRDAYPGDREGQVTTNVPQIMKLAQSIGVGDLVLLCGRYDSVKKNRHIPVQVYGIARTNRVDGQSFFVDKNSDWYRYKRPATIQVIEKRIRRKIIEKALVKKGSLVQTLQPLDGADFGRLGDLLHAEFGIGINV